VITLILFGSQETFLLIIINVENCFAALYFCGNLVDLFRSLWIKNSIYLKWKSFVMLLCLYCHFWSI